MAAQLPLEASHIVALFVEALSYGVYLITCAHCASSLLTTGRSPRRWRRREELQLVIICSALALFIDLTLNLALALHRVIRAFVYAPGALLDLGDVSSWVNIAKAATFSVGPIIGDAILIYRCYIVYQSWKIVVPPILMWIGGIVCASTGIAFQAKSSRSGYRGTLYASEMLKFSYGFAALYVTQNIITSGLLIWKIWQVERTNRRILCLSSSSSDDTLTKVIRAIAESGVLMTVPSIASLISRLAGSNATYIMSALNLIFIGIAFNLIVIRASRSGEGGGGSATAPSIPLAFRNRDTSKSDEVFSRNREETDAP